MSKFPAGSGNHNGFVHRMTQEEKKTVQSGPNVSTYVKFTAQSTHSS